MRSNYSDWLLVVVELADWLEEGGIARPWARTRVSCRRARVVVEEAVEAEYVGVAQVRLDLDLAAQLVLTNDLERHDVISTRSTRFHFQVRVGRHISRVGYVAAARVAC